MGRGYICPDCLEMFYEKHPLCPDCGEARIETVEEWGRHQAVAPAIVMSQSKKGSLTEALINVAIGFSINYVANLLIFPLFDMHISMSDNLLLGFIYTAISIVRSYVIRRWFNQYIVKAAKSMSSS